MEEKGTVSRRRMRNERLGFILFLSLGIALPIRAHADTARWHYVASIGGAIPFEQPFPQYTATMSGAVGMTAAREARGPFEPQASVAWQRLALVDARSTTDIAPSYDGAMFSMSAGCRFRPSGAHFSFALSPAVLALRLRAHRAGGVYREGFLTSVAPGASAEARVHFEPARSLRFEIAMSGLIAGPYHDRSTAPPQDNFGTLQVLRASLGVGF